MSMKILAVEDDPAVAQTLQLHVAPDREARLPLAEVFDDDLILLDVILPKLEGAVHTKSYERRDFKVPYCC